MGMICGICGLERPTEFFAEQSDTDLGVLIRDTTCRFCLFGQIDFREWRRLRLRGRHLCGAANDRRRLTDIGRKAGRLWSSAKCRAHKLGVEFRLEVEWIAKRIERGCEVSGLPFHIAAGRGRSNFTPSVDRINPKGGYTPENCRVVVWMYNTAKGVGSHGDIEALARGMVGKASADVSRGTCNLPASFRDHVNKTWQSHPIKGAA